LLFQSTRPQGARLIPCSICQNCGCFNPRARRGRDAFFIAYSSPLQSFNPRARRGRDFSWLRSESFQAVSIHAPAGGATSCVQDYAVGRAFQSTRPQGARPQ